MKILKINNLKRVVGLCGLILGFYTSHSFSQQININRIEQMPNLPSPYEMRNWKHVAQGYDSLIFDFTLSGTYLPLIWWRTNKINYPHQSLVQV
jgi:hypothetical protein